MSEVPQGTGERVGVFIQLPLVLSVCRGANSTADRVYCTVVKLGSRGKRAQRQSNATGIGKLGLCVLSAKAGGGQGEGDCSMLHQNHI